MKEHDIDWGGPEFGSEVIFYLKEVKTSNELQS